MLVLARAGVKTPSFFRSMTPVEFFNQLSAFLDALGPPSSSIAGEWELRDKKPAKAKSYIQARLFRIEASSQFIVLRSEGRHNKITVSGPLTFETRDPPIPACNARDVSGRTIYNLVGPPTLRCSLRFRSPGPTLQQLELNNYAELLLPMCPPNALANAGNIASGDSHAGADA
jgi:hypothetical protein